MKLAGIKKMEMGIFVGFFLVQNNQIAICIFPLPPSSFPKIARLSAEIISGVGA
jgi:hypothetical protein